MTKPSPPQFPGNTPGVQPRRPQNFTPYEYQFSIEELQQLFSPAQMAAAERAVAHLEITNARGAYQPAAESLARHSIPEWWLDAKFGMFYDWGLYAVAGYDTKEWNRARYPDCYLLMMDNKLRAYHEQTWGCDFERDDFIPCFTGADFDAEEVTRLAVAAGQKYIVHFHKHMDGYCQWESTFTHRNSVVMPPQRDFTAEMAAACRRHDLRYGFYFGVEEMEYPIISRLDDSLQVRLFSRRQPEINPHTGDYSLTRPFDPLRDNRTFSGKVPVRNYVNHYLLPLAKEFIDKYDPDILWLDGEWDRPAEDFRSLDLAAYFYNHAGGRKQVALADRLGENSRGRMGDFFTSEFDDGNNSLTHPWEENRPMGESYGYYYADNDETLNSATDLVHILVRTVAKGGNLLLMLCPTGSGAIPENQAARLKEMGEWLRVNGEAIYATRPRHQALPNAATGATDDTRHATLRINIPGYGASGLDWMLYTPSEDNSLGQNVWYTLSKDGRYTYAICFNLFRLGSDTLVLRRARPKPNTKVKMLGFDQPLDCIWVAAYGMVIRLPEELRDPANRPCRHAWVFRFEN